jgi:hypothetical protein
MSRIVPALFSIAGRVRREPALLTAAVLAVGNLLGADLSDTANTLESLIVLLGGYIVRQRVTPVVKQ